jgi:hypothetical protein
LDPLFSQEVVDNRVDQHRIEKKGNAETAQPLHPERTGAFSIVARGCEVASHQEEKPQERGLEETAKPGYDQKDDGTKRVNRVALNIVPPTRAFVGDPRVIENHKDREQDLYVIQEKEAWSLGFFAHGNRPPLFCDSTWALAK